MRVLSCNPAWAHLHVHASAPLDGSAKPRRKTVELRTWSADISGETIALHANGTAPSMDALAWYDLPEDMPRGAIIALVRYSIRPAVLADGHLAMVGTTGMRNAADTAMRSAMAKAESAGRILLAWEVQAIAPLEAKDPRLAYRKGAPGRLTETDVPQDIVDAAKGRHHHGVDLSA